MAILSVNRKKQLNASGQYANAENHFLAAVKTRIPTAAANNPDHPRRTVHKKQKRKTHRTRNNIRRRRRTSLSCSRRVGLVLLVLVLVVKAALRPSVVVAISPGVAGGIIHGSARYSARRWALSILSSHGGWLMVVSMLVLWLFVRKSWHPWWFAKDEALAQPAMVPSPWNPWLSQALSVNPLTASGDRLCIQDGAILL